MVSPERFTLLHVSCRYSISMLVCLLSSFIFSVSYGVLNKLFIGTLYIWSLLLFEVQRSVWRPLSHLIKPLSPKMINQALHYRKLHLDHLKYDFACYTCATFIYNIYRKVHICVLMVVFWVSVMVHKNSEIFSAVCHEMSTFMLCSHLDTLWDPR